MHSVLIPIAKLGALFIVLQIHGIAIERERRTSEGWPNSTYAIMPILKKKINITTKKIDNVQCVPA